MLLDEIKRRMMAAMKAGNIVEKEVLRTLVGELTMADAKGLLKGDGDASAIVRKLAKANEETLSLATDPKQRADLELELTVLRSLVPSTLSVEAICEALAPVKAELLGAKGDGQATGLAMKHLKATGALVDGKDVTRAVQRLRGAG
ncbi:MAG: GatB/YqeY domain-containing protein [Deltaproteobacteria bacterium]|nr:GatB/YqeY domain-containing protein [Deltaproteobacteria bacterium]